MSCAVYGVRLVYGLHVVTGLYEIIYSTLFWSWYTNKGNKLGTRKLGTRGKLITRYVDWLKWPDR
jgi:hypothetical protein